MAGEPAEDDGEVLSVGGGEKARDVLDENPTGSEFISETPELVPESRAVAIQSRTRASHGDVLTWESSAEEIDSRNVVCSDIAHIV